MVYKANIPQPTQNLDTSQNDLLNNFAQLDTSFGVDHVNYSDTSGDTGKHNTVTYVVQSPEPSTAVNEVKGFSFVPGTNTNEIQFSRGPSDSISTPLTALQSAGLDDYTETPTLILDFSGITRAVFEAFAFQSGSDTRHIISGSFDGTTIRLANVSPALVILQWTVSNNNELKLGRTQAGNTTNVFWTLKFHRLT